MEPSSIKGGNANASPDFELIRNDIKVSWKYAVRAFNASQKTGATDTGYQISRAIVELSAILEFCESMTGK